ncbi:MAG: hypothetical protein KAT71_05750, partial [Gammaproteobacteria bacterium]|nr:hypothetical protein [Gammaproteobacteria bacterium]
MVNGKGQKKPIFHQDAVTRDPVDHECQDIYHAENFGLCVIDGAEIFLHNREYGVRTFHHLLDGLLQQRQTHSKLILIAPTQEVGAMQELLQGKLQAQGGCLMTAEANQLELAEEQVDNILQLVRARKHGPQDQPLARAMDFADQDGPAMPQQILGVDLLKPILLGQDSLDKVRLFSLFRRPTILSGVLKNIDWDFHPEVKLDPQFQEQDILVRRPV